MILAPAQMSLLQKSSRITLKMSIFHRLFYDRFFLRHLVILQSVTAAEEAWALGQISRCPGWYSQLRFMKGRTVVAKKPKTALKSAQILNGSRVRNLTPRKMKGHVPTRTAVTPK